MNTVNVILCGVGGQNVLRAGELLSRAAMHAGYDVKMSAPSSGEHSGESTSCHVRWGQKVYSPVIRQGEADFIISFEQMETLRQLPMGKNGVAVIVNDDVIPPRAGRESFPYPDNIEDLVNAVHGTFHLIPAKHLSGEDGHVALTLLGAFAAFNQCSQESWVQAIREWADGDPESSLAVFHQGQESVHEPLRIEVGERFELPDSPTPKGVRSFDEMLALVKTLPQRRVAIAGAENKAALHAGIECVELGLGTPVFVGNADVIRRTSAEQYPEFPIGNYEILDARDEAATAERAVAIVRGGDADILLKGGVNTPTLMRAVLNGKTGLRSGSLLSDTFVFEYPDEDGIRLIMITDGGVTLQPTVQQKVEILKNAVVVAHALGNVMPRVAILAASETINPNVAATMDAAVITKMNRTGQIPGCVIEGPIALDVAVSRKAAAIKGTDSPVAGQADILVAANIDTANALAKSTTYFAGYRLSHVIVGGTAPILIASRSDTSDAKLLSVALGSLMAKYFEEQRDALKR
ncbi:MAG: 2-oxoacid:acceptor oxidoreductase family protein [Ignavibacteria bacterium]|nr:2-oxoacid:acceptor oxidoreductase family protein [Ignavibacteria bacterium]